MVELSGDAIQIAYGLATLLCPPTSVGLACSASFRYRLVPTGPGPRAGTPDQGLSIPGLSRGSTMSRHITMWTWRDDV
jgi:hypothetical protein